MARETQAQQETVERVMHEFKEGELRTSAGDPVASRKQAIAISLSGADASDQQTPGPDRRRLAKTKPGERAEEPTKAEL